MIRALAFYIRKCMEEKLLGINEESPSKEVYTLTIE